jgi:hypothetical protein
MKVEAPPGRYRIVERDRRLVTIDTATGAEIGVTAAMAAQSDIITGSSGMARSGMAETIGSSRPSALSEAAARPAVEASAAKAAALRIAMTPQKANKIVILITGVIVLAVILILTSLWPFAIVALVLKPSRDFLWARMKPALLRYLGDDGAAGR